MPKPCEDAMTTKRKQREHKYQLTDGTWYKSAHGRPPYLHECCDCGLTHRIEYKYEQGAVWERWTIDEKETQRSRKLRDAAAK
jgi:hypothetical protein